MPTTQRHKLTPKQAAFVREYLVDLNGTQAAIRAGYSKRTARAIAAENLAKPYLLEALTRARNRRAERTEVTADRVLQELARIGFADVRNLFEWDEESASFVPSRNLSEEEAAAVASVKAETTHSTFKDGTRETTIRLELKTYDKVAALREIGKHLGIAEHIEHSGEIGGVLRIPMAETGRVDWRAMARTQQNRIGQRPEVATAPGTNGNGNGNGNGKHP